jgi:hypothetical protein
MKSTVRRLFLRWLPSTNFFNFLSALLAGAGLNYITVLSVGGNTINRWLLLSTALPWLLSAAFLASFTEGLSQVSSDAAGLAGSELSSAERHELRLTFLEQAWLRLRWVLLVALIFAALGTIMSLHTYGQSLPPEVILV